MQRRQAGHHLGGQNRGGQHQKPDRHPDETEVQDRHQGLGQAAPAAPARQPHQTQRPGQRGQSAGDAGLGQRHPQRQRRAGGHQTDAVKAPDRGGQGAGGASRQPVAGKAGHHPPADQADQKHQRRHPQPGARAIRAAAALPVKQRVGGEQQQERGQHQQIAPVAPGNDLARDQGGKGQKEREVQRRRQPRPDQARSRHRQPSNDPHRRQPAQGPAHHRQPPGPVRHRRQHKPGGNAGKQPEQQFMHVPVTRSKGGGQGQSTGKLCQPQPHRGQRPEPGQKEEGPKAEAQHGRPAKGARTAHGGGHCGLLYESIDPL